MDGETCRKLCSRTCTSSGSERQDGNYTQVSNRVAQVPKRRHAHLPSHHDCYFPDASTMGRRTHIQVHVLRPHPSQMVRMLRTISRLLPGRRETMRSRVHRRGIVQRDSIMFALVIYIYIYIYILLLLLYNFIYLSLSIYI